MKFTVYLHAQLNTEWFREEITYRVSTLDMTEQWGPVISKVEVDFPIDSLEKDALFSDIIERLREKQSKIRAEAENKAAEIEDKISKLTAPNGESNV